MKENYRDWTAQGEHEYRQATHKPGIVLDASMQRECTFCKKPEYRGQFRNGRCRQCRKALA